MFQSKKGLCLFVGAVVDTAVGLGDAVTMAVQGALALPADWLALVVVAVRADVTGLAAVVLVIPGVDALVSGFVLVGVELAAVVRVAVLLALAGLGAGRVATLDFRAPFLAALRVLGRDALAFPRVVALVACVGALAGMAEGRRVFQRRFAVVVVLACRCLFVSVALVAVFVVALFAAPFALVRLAAPSVTVVDISLAPVFVFRVAPLAVVVPALFKKGSFVDVVAGDEVSFNGAEARGQGRGREEGEGEGCNRSE